MSELLTAQEVSKELGIANDGTKVYRLGVPFIKGEVNGKKRKVITREAFEAWRNGEAPPVAPVAVDPVIEALGTLELGIRQLKRALKRHDTDVRREAVRTFVESLRDGVL